MAGIVALIVVVALGYMVHKLGKRVSALEKEIPSLRNIPQGRGDAE